MIDEDHVQQIAEFLKEYNFVVIDKTKNKMKLGSMAREFLTQEATA